MPIRLSGINSGLDTDSIVQALVSSYSYKKDKLKKQQTKLNWTQDAWKALNTKVYSLYTSVSNLRFSSGYVTKKATISDATKASVSAGSGAVVGTQKLNVLSVAQSGYLTGGKLSSSVKPSSTLEDLGYKSGDCSIKLTFGDPNSADGTKETKIDINESTKIEDILKQFNEAGITANFDSGNGRIFLSSKSSGKAGDFKLAGADAKGVEALTALGLNTELDADDEKKATKLDGKDCEIKLNGVLFKSASNTITVNGLSVTAMNETGDGDANAISISTTTDSQAMYDKIKEFLTQYNNIMNEMSSLYNASSAKGYEPLTDDEKAEMSDKEVEDWESKIKDSLLRRDATLNTLMTAMSTAMSKTISVEGKSYSLSSFGISTLSYSASSKNGRYAYHIDGDEEDENTSGKTDKLMAAINNDPDTVVDFMKQLTKGLYDAIGEKMSSSSLSSAYTIYNDKQMTLQNTQYTKLISDWEKKITEKEDYYYNKFSKMESALASLNSTQSSLSGFFQ